MGIWYTFLRVDASPLASATPEAEEILLYDVDPNQIQKVRLQDLDSGETTILARDGDGWQMEAPVQGEAYFLRVDSLVFDLSRIAVDRKLDNPDDLATYGLSPAQLRVTITLADDTENTLLIGNENPDQNYAYAIKIGDPAVYLVDFAIRDDVMEFISSPPFTPTPSPTPEPIGTRAPTPAP